MNDVRASIKLAAQRTGLSAHVIRMWEKRYDAVTPNRTDTKRRLYSDEDIERLGLLRSATVAGHRIGDIAQLPTERLRELSDNAPSTPARNAAPPSTADDTINAALEATRAFDVAGLQSTLEHGAVAFGLQGLLQRVIAPLARHIGDQWADGTLTAAHEHFATGSISAYLERQAHSFAAGQSAPLLVVVTPAGQLHELGAIMTSTTARAVGWRVVYLGASLPAPEIAGAATSKGARAVALSLVYPGDDPALPGELQFLRKLLPPEIAIIAGGRVASNYAPTLEAIGAHRSEDLSAFVALLNRLRGVAPSG